MSSHRGTTSASKKRKHNSSAESEDETLEIDVNAPEPPSKKAKRKEKKLSKQKPVIQDPSVKEANETTENAELAPISDERAKSGQAAAKPAQRSEYGIWIGNLPFSANKEILRDFLRQEGGIDEAAISRVHMPTGEKGQNRGFAYVDFSTQAVLDIALPLTERLLLGRKVLIKNAKSFEGRPKKPDAGIGTAGDVNKKEANKRIFVGNLSFDITQEDLAQHFAQAGKIDGIHMATFEDSGKCKGFAWVTFADIDAAKSAVRGFVLQEVTDENDDEDRRETDALSENKESSAQQKRSNSKPKKPQKWFINRLNGRELRCEFAEDPQTRYKKRFASGNKTQLENSDHDQAVAKGDCSNYGDRLPTQHADQKTMPKMKLNKDERQDERRKKHDARKTAPGKALAMSQRASTAIVAATGSKVTFD